MLFVVIFAADTCPAGMRKTYIDDTNTIAHGSGYSPYGAICFYDDPGSLFLNRRKVNYNYSDNSKNTTSKILEHRIDESYLSLRTSKISPQPQNPHNTTFPKKSSTNPLQFFKFN